AERGGALGAIMNAANEMAVDAFTSGKIAFGEIAEVVEAVVAGSGSIMSQSQIQSGGDHVQSGASLDDLLMADRAARDAATREIDCRKTSSPAAAYRR